MSFSPLDVLGDEPALLLAVSGGPDSTALLLMAAEWALPLPPCGGGLGWGVVARSELSATPTPKPDHPPTLTLPREGGGNAAQPLRPRLFAATVDHRLRSESADEAAAVAALAARLGVPHATLRWQGEKPRARLQERAREARYELLAAHASAVGARTIVTAHHLDDQAETVLFRLMRGSGLAGLAGMAARSRRGEIEIARPLLGIPKAELVAFCDARGVAYARDPSNSDPRFARPRLRALADALAAEGLDAPALARLARRAATVEAALAAKTAEVERRLRLIATGRCEGKALAAEPVEIVRRLLTLAVAKSSGADPARVPLDAMERIAADALAAAAAGRDYAANVAGALIVHQRAGVITIEPEPPRRA